VVRKTDLPITFRLTIQKQMFCPSCGVEYTIELKYCNRCGANLNTLVAPQPAPVVVNVTKPILIISSLITFITLGGMGGLVGGATGLAPILQGKQDPLIAMMVLGMLTILVVDVSLIRLLSKLINSALSSPPAQMSSPSFVSHQPAGQFQPSSTARLQGAPSVTENTTRFFESTEPAPVRKQK
jgi:hypothetical protein